MTWWKKLLWMGISALGVWAIAVLALSRGEQISALWIVLAGFCALSISYRFYSKWLATKVLLLNEGRATPAVLQNDNKDYVPTNRWMVFGHHFAAIAGPGPLVGPVLAAQFGFLPGTLWILIGATLGGGVHDMIVLFASIRRGGKTLGQMVKEEVGRGVGLLALISVLAIMIILLAVLALVVVQALAQSPWGVFTIAVTIPLALIMGIALRTGKVGVLGGFTSAVVLSIVALLMAGESVHRLFVPLEIHFNEAIGIACLGLLVNLGCAVLLADRHHDHGGGSSHREDLNLRAAYLHVLADAFTSVLAITALTGGKFFGWAWLDPVVGIVGSGVVFSWAYTLLRDTSGILLDRTPASSDLPDEIRRAVESDGDSLVSDLHVWQVGIGKFAAMISVVAHEPKSCDAYRALLRGHDELVHVTIETHLCREDHQSMASP